MTKNRNPLPPYELAVLADRQEGDEHVNLIALLYADTETAEHAARELTRRLAGFGSTEAFGNLAIHIDEPRVQLSDTGLAAAIAAVRYPLPSAQDGEATPPGAVLRSWFRALYARELYPLHIGFSRQWARKAEQGRKHLSPRLCSCSVAYSLTGRGTVVTGIVETGSLRTNDSNWILSANEDDEDRVKYETVVTGVRAGSIDHEASVGEQEGLLVSRVAHANVGTGDIVIGIHENAEPPPGPVLDVVFEAVG